MQFLLPSSELWLLWQRENRARQKSQTLSFLHVFNYFCNMGIIMLPISCFFFHFTNANDYSLSSHFKILWSQHIILSFKVHLSSSKLNSWILPSWGQHKQVKNGKTTWRYFLKCSRIQGRMIFPYWRAKQPWKSPTTSPDHFMLSPTFVEQGSVGGKQWDGQSNLVYVILLGFLHHLNGLGQMVNSTVMEMTECIIEFPKTKR